MPEKLDRCVADVKAQGKSDDSAWGICVDSTGEKPGHETKIKEHVGDNEFLIKGKPSKTRPNANRQVPVFNPPITKGRIKPKIDKTTKGIGGQVGKIDSNSNTNNITTDLWKQILDAQLKQNVKEHKI